LKIYFLCNLYLQICQNISIKHHVFLKQETMRIQARTLELANDLDGHVRNKQMYLN